MRNPWRWPSLTVVLSLRVFVQIGFCEGTTAIVDETRYNANVISPLPGTALLVPKLCLGTQVRETLFRVQPRNVTVLTARQTEFARPTFPNRVWERGSGLRGIFAEKKFRNQCPRPRSSFVIVMKAGRKARSAEGKLHKRSMSMAKFLFVYRGSGESMAKMSPEEMQQHNQKWFTWIQEGMQKGWMINPGDALTQEGCVVTAKVI